MRKYKVQCLFAFCVFFEVHSVLWNEFWRSDRWIWVSIMQSFQTALLSIFWASGEASCLLGSACQFLRAHDLCHSLTHDHSLNRPIFFTVWPASQRVPVHFPVVSTQQRAVHFIYCLLYYRNTYYYYCILIFCTSTTMTKILTAKLTIRTTPAIMDPRQLDSVITASLRALFGDCQPYSCELRVLECRPCPSSGGSSSKSSSSLNSNSYDAVLECPVLSVDYIRAALTFSTTPQFLDGEMYRIDFLHCDAKV